VEVPLVETAAQQPLRVAVHHTGPSPALVRQLGSGVLARLVHHPREVRATDDLVVVLAGAGGFERELADELGPLAPPVLVVVDRADPARVPSRGVAGYLVVDGLDGLAAGLMPFAMLATSRRPGPLARTAGQVPAEPLTPRERDIMTLLAAGCSIREIAESLAIGGKTVRNYLSNIYRKLGVRRQAEALLRWLDLVEMRTA
jgi:DNA-binding CsgD family transcriptional regulator